jgi:hypothetical protein
MLFWKISLLLKGNMAHVKFPWPCNVVIGICLISVLEENITCARFHLFGNVFVKSMVLFVDEINLRQISFSLKSVFVWLVLCFVFVLEENIRDVGFLFALQ